MARAGRLEPSASGRARSQAQDAVREVRKQTPTQQRKYAKNKEKKERAPRRSALGILAALADTSIVDVKAQLRIKHADAAGLSSSDWRAWIQFQIELLIRSLTGEKPLSADLAIQRAATISREIRDYLDATGGQAAPVAVSVSTTISPKVLDSLKSAGVNIDVNDFGDEIMIH